MLDRLCERAQIGRMRLSCFPTWLAVGGVLWGVSATVTADASLSHGWSAPLRDCVAEAVHQSADGEILVVCSDDRANASTVLRYDRDGNVLEATALAASGLRLETRTVRASWAEAGYLWIAADVTNADGVERAVLLALDSYSLELLWSREYTVANGAFVHGLRGLRNGDVVIAWLGLEAQGPRLWLARHDPKGTRLTVTAATLPGRPADGLSQSLDIGPDGSVYVLTGHELLRFGVNGDLRWRRGCRGVALAVDSAGYAWVTTPIEPSGHTVRFDGGGAEVWTVNRGGHAIGVGAQGTAFIARTEFERDSGDTGVRIHVLNTVREPVTLVLDSQEPEAIVQVAIDRAGDAFLLLKSSTRDWLGRAQPESVLWHVGAEGVLLDELSLRQVAWPRALSVGNDGVSVVGYQGVAWVEHKATPSSCSWIFLWACFVP